MCVHPLLYWLNKEADGDEDGGARKALVTRVFLLSTSLSLYWILSFVNASFGYYVCDVILKFML